MEELELLKKTHALLLIQLGSETCLPCKAIQGKIRDFQREHPALHFAYLPIEAHRPLASQLGIFTVPTLLFYAEGRLTYRESGFFSLELLLQRIARCEELMKE